MSDLTPIVIPVVVAVILSVSGSFVVSRFSGPAQTAYIAAVEGRLQVVSKERDEALARIPKLEARIESLETEVGYLKERERRLLIRLDKDEARLTEPPRA